MSRNVLNNIVTVHFSHKTVEIRVLKAVCVFEDCCLLGEPNDEDYNSPREFSALSSNYEM
jgi:hypothetical protein